MRRRPDDPFGKIDPAALAGTGAGDPSIPYDRTGQAPAPAPEEVPAQAAPDPTMQEGGDPNAQPPAAMLSGLSQAPANTDQLDNTQLQALNQVPQGMQSPQEIEVQQMEAALQDPNVPPEQKQIIQQQIALAARRQLAGIGGLGA